MALSKETILKVIKSVTEDIEIYEHRNQLSITVPKESIVEVANALKTDSSTKFNHLVDITAIDWLKSENRFDVVYFVNSLEYNYKLRLKVKVDESDLTCPTLTGVWGSANWYERETYDMYGVKFEGHPGLRRFYMPEDFNDPETGESLHPLRKDFPLMGIPGTLPLPPYPEKYGETKD
jgi:NADH-quinone oxidoreductase subunit C